MQKEHKPNPLTPFDATDRELIAGPAGSGTLKSV